MDRLYSHRLYCTLFPAACQQKAYVYRFVIRIPQKRSFSARRGEILILVWSDEYYRELLRGFENAPCRKISEEGYQEKEGLTAFGML